MSIVDFNSSIWTDPWFHKLPYSAKTLFIYLWTNNHKNLVGLYPLEIETMEFETGIPVDEIKELLNILYPKVKYDPDNQIVFVVNHVKHQFLRTEHISMKIEIGIAKCLRILPEGHPFICEFLNKYHKVSEKDIQYTFQDTLQVKERVKERMQVRVRVKVEERRFLLVLVLIYLILRSLGDASAKPTKPSILH